MEHVLIDIIKRPNTNSEHRRRKRCTKIFSIETLKERKVWSDVFQDKKENICQPRLLCTTKLSLIIGVGI
jgi:hypothetical protein